jgi:proteasome lid subunit RPN8/RPN11
MMSDKGVRYQYVLEVYKKDDLHEHLGDFTFKPNWEPALEWARFCAMCVDPRPPYVLGGDRGTIEPRWHARAGPPYLDGVKAVVPYDGLPPVGFDIPLEYFTDAARAASSAMVEHGKLAAGELFEYLVCAYECRDQPAAQGPTQPPTFCIKRVEQVLDVNDLDMGDLLALSSPYDPLDDEQMPVFMPREMIHEAVELMVRADDKETGGILIGHMRRDPRRRKLFLEATAQIAVEHAQQELARLTFTPETWTAVDAALALRGKGEIQIGWWHSHPASHWCDECPPERRQRCKTAGAPSGDFFSGHDVALHRTVFPRAYSIALVISDGCGNAGVPSWRLFGWRYGMVMARGFHLLEAAEPPAAAAVQIGGEAHVPS